MRWRNDTARELIKKRGFRTDWLADECGIAVSTMRNILRGAAKPSLSVVKILAQKLNCSESDLLTEGGDDQKRA